jgi:hypothetical protein
MAARPRITGLKAMDAKLQRLATRFPNEVERALYLRAEAIMTRSKREFVPVDLGTLRGTGHVSPPERRGRRVRVALSYGGPAAPYATAVHEHLSAASPPSWKGAEKAGRPVTFHPAGHGPKYLERPLFDAVPTLAAEIARDLHLPRMVT